MLSAKHGGGVTKDEILAQIDDDIEANEKSFLFWKRQEQLQLDTPLGEVVENHVRRLEMTLAQLHDARDIVSDA